MIYRDMKFLRLVSLRSNCVKSGPKTPSRGREPKWRRKPSKTTFMVPKRPRALVLRAWAAIIFIAVSFFGHLAAAQGVKPEVVAANLQNPWGLAFLPEGRFLVTERPGRLRVIEASGKLGAPVAGVPAVVSGGQGGLLDVIVDSDFANNRSLYFCFSERAVSGSANSTALARATLSTACCRYWKAWGCVRLKSPPAPSWAFPSGRWRWPSRPTTTSGPWW